MLELAANRKTIVPDYPHAMDTSSANLFGMAARNGGRFIAIHPGAKGAQSMGDIIICSNWSTNILARNRDFMPALNFELSHRVGRTIVPFKWAFGIIDSASKANANEEMMDLLYEFHRSECWVIPVHGPRGNVGLVALGELETELTLQDVAAWQAASFELFDDHFKQNQNSLINSDRLSATEVKILQLMIDGASTNEISALVKLSPFAVDAYITNAKSKLNSTTKVQAVAQAIRNGEIG